MPLICYEIKYALPQIKNLREPGDNGITEELMSDEKAQIVPVVLIHKKKNYRQ